MQSSYFPAGTVLASIRKSSLVDGLFRRDVPEYPEEAVREAVVNAVAHRDYSSFVRGSYIQVRLFADRLEVRSPSANASVSVEQQRCERFPHVPRDTVAQHAVPSFPAYLLLHQPASPPTARFPAPAQEKRLTTGAASTILNA